MTDTEVDVWEHSEMDGGQFALCSYPLVQASLAVKRRAGCDFGLQDKISFTVYTTGIQVATVLASGVHLQGERQTCTYGFYVHKKAVKAAKKLFSPL